MEAVGDDCKDDVKYSSNGAACGMIYKGMARLVLLYGSEIWVVTG